MASKTGWNPVTETPDLTGKVAVVTGGNASIGYETVKHLTTHGAKVYMVSRSEKRGKEAIKKLQEEGALTKGSVELALIDLSLLQDVKRGADAIISQETKIDILVNNAGLLASNERHVTKEGIVDTLATNHLGPFTLTTALLPLLKKAASEPSSDVRIVMVSSDSHSFAPKVGTLKSLQDLDVCKPTGMMDAMKRYAMSKMCSVWFTRDLQRRLDEEKVPITVVMVDPGAVASPGARTSLGALPGPIAALVWPVIRLFMATPLTAAYPSIFAATSPVVIKDRDQYHGLHIVTRQKLDIPKGEGTSADLARQLWEVSERVEAEVLAKGHTSGPDDMAA